MKVICFGDSNTHGYCADPKDCADGGIRYNESERWTCLLGERLGPDTLVLEEGLSGRTGPLPPPDSPRPAPAEADGSSAQIH